MTRPAVPTDAAVLDAMSADLACIALHQAVVRLERAHAAPDLAPDLLALTPGDPLTAEGRAVCGLSA